MVNTSYGKPILGGNENCDKCNKIRSKGNKSLLNIVKQFLSICMLEYLCINAKFLETTTDNEEIFEFQTTFSGSRLLKIKHDWNSIYQDNDLLNQRYDMILGIIQLILKEMYKTLNHKK
jgi:hypothetical protein